MSDEASTPAVRFAYGHPEDGLGANSLFLLQRINDAAVMALGSLSCSLLSGWQS